MFIGVLIGGDIQIVRQYGMSLSVFLLGFGEAAQTFCGAEDWTAEAFGFDIKLEQEPEQVTKRAEFEAHNVRVGHDLENEVSRADIVISLVTADQSYEAAQRLAPFTQKQALYLDMNSVSPARKRATEQLFSGLRAQYVDAAIMAPVDPAALEVPILLSGQNSMAAQEALAAVGFSCVRVVGPRVGSASTIKMIRSVLIKGLEALTAEVMIAAEAASVRKEVLESIDPYWVSKTNYNLERMLVHGERRAAEMEQVCQTLLDLGVEPIMSTGTEILQRSIGKLGRGAAPAELSSKLDLIGSPSIGALL